MVHIALETTVRTPDINLERYRLLFESANDAIFTMNNDTFIDCNNKTLEMFQCMRDQIIGQPPYRFSPSRQPDGRDSMEKALEKIGLALSGQPQHFEWMHCHYDGTPFHAEVSLNRLDLEGKTFIQAIVRDVHNRKMAEDERDRAMAELELKNKELENIVYVASHDLRSPLVNILGFSERLEKSCNDLRQLLNGSDAPEQLKTGCSKVLDEKIPASLKFIKTSVTKMNMLINGLLRLSRTGRAVLRIGRIDMKKLLENVVGSMFIQIEKSHAEVKTGHLPDCIGDTVQINQVFSNLLDNALKYRKPTRALKIAVFGKTEGRKAVYCVEDNGIGIAPEHQQKVWELFHRLNPQGEVAGEGLGLTLVMRILNRHHGHAWIESAPEGGCRFYVALPAAEETDGAL